MKCFKYITLDVVCIVSKNPVKIVFNRSLLLRFRFDILFVPLRKVFLHGKVLLGGRIPYTKRQQIMLLFVPGQDRCQFRDISPHGVFITNIFKNMGNTYKVWIPRDTPVMHKIKKNSVTDFVNDIQLLKFLNYSYRLLFV